MKHLFLLLLTQTIFAVNMINLTLDPNPAYIIENNQLGEDYLNSHAYGNAALSIGYSQDIYNAEHFLLSGGGEFMMGRKSEDKRAIFSIHSVYLSPTLIVDERVHLFTRLGYNIVNADTEISSFDSLSGGFNFGVGLSYKVTDNYVLSFQNILHQTSGEDNGVEYDFVYNRYGLVLSYGIDLIKGD